MVKIKVNGKLLVVKENDIIVVQERPKKEYDRNSETHTAIFLN